MMHKVSSTTLAVFHIVFGTVAISLGATSSAWSQPQAGKYPAAEEFLAAHGDFVSNAKRYEPMIELSSYYIPDMELDGEPGEFDEFRYELEALVPIPVSRDSFLLAGAHAGAREYTFSNDSFFDDETVYNLGLRFGGGRFFSDDFVLQGYWQPSIYSDLGGPPYSEDWKLWYGAALAVYRASDTFFWKGGILLSDALNSSVIPLVGFAWLPRPRWRVDVLAPRRVELSYLPNRAWDLAVGMRVDAEEYTIRQDTAAGELRRDIRMQDIRYYFGAMRKFENGLSFFGRAGVASGGEYDWGSGFNGENEAALFLRGGAGFSF